MRDTFKKCSSIFVALLAVVLFLTLGAGLAVAAEGIEEVTPFQSMNFTVIHVEISDEFGSESIWVGLISGELPEYTPLPARIEVAVPEGTLTGWAGQLPSSDGFESAMQFPDFAHVRTENGMDVYSAVMTQFHFMQLETRIEESPIVESDDAGMTWALSYTPVHDLDELQLTAAFPAGFVSQDDGIRYFGDGPEGEQSYYHVFENVSAGVPVSTTISAFYVGADEGAESATDPTTIIIIVCISIALIALTYVFFVRGINTKE